MTDNDETTTPLLEPATVYLLAEHQIILEELKLKLRREGVKSSKSKLVRAAINLLEKQTIENIIRRLQRDKAE
jgi:hypothetical protein